MEVVALAAGGACGTAGATLAVLYTSPVLSHFPFDSCNTCYSPPQVVSVPRGSINLSAAEGLVFALRFTDNQRNVQIKLPLPLTVYWA